MKRTLGCICAALAIAAAGCGLTQPHQVTWSGDVDDTATIDFQGAKSWVDTATDKGVQNAAANFQGTLPSSPLTSASVTKTAGRGTVALVQQPTKDNNYTAAVRVVDSEPGPDHYRFVLKW